MGLGFLILQDNYKTVLPLLRLQIFSNKYANQLKV